MYKKIIENNFEIGSHKITTEFFDLSDLSDREKKILSNAIASGMVEVVVDTIDEEVEVVVDTIDEEVEVVVDTIDEEVEVVVDKKTRAKK